MGKFGYNELKLSKACLLYAADATNLITVGRVRVAAVDYNNGTAIDALAADTWTDVQDINLGVPFQFLIMPPTGSAFRIVMGAETAGDYVRGQWEIDGVAVVDFTVGPSKTQSLDPFYHTVLAANAPTLPFFAKSRFRVRLFKHGTIDGGSSTINCGPIVYQEVTL